MVEAALALAGADFTRVDVSKSEAQSAAFRKLSPFGQVPILVLADGEVMAESAAMCLLISDRHPEAKLGPPVSSNERPAFLRWLLFMATVVYPAALRRYYSDRYTSDPAGAVAVAEAALLEFERGLDVIETHLARRDWLAGDRSIADVYLLMLVLWHPDYAAAKRRWPKVQNIAATLQGDPALIDLNSYYDMW